MRYIYGVISTITQLNYYALFGLQHFTEAYDLANDMYQIENVAYDLLPSIRAKYDLALTNLTQCAGATCRRIY